jgi:hypothetical protein
VPDEEEKDSFSGFSANTSLEARLGRFNVRMQVARAPRFSFQVNNVFFIEESAGMGLSYYLSRFLRIDYNFRYAQGKYPEEILVQFPDSQFEWIKRSDIYRTHSANIIIRIIKNYGIGLTINFWSRDSNYFDEIRDRMFIGVRITHDF